MKVDRQSEGTKLCARESCPVEFVPRKSWQIFHDSACRKADWKRRHGYEYPGTTHASRDASRTGINARSGTQVSYPKLARDLADALAHSPTDRDIALEVARACLPARQRERLEARS